jgi:hypothetical protein
MLMDSNYQLAIINAISLPASPYLVLIKLVRAKFKE